MNHSSEDLEKRLKSFYERQTLDPDVLANLKRSINRTKVEEKEQNWFLSLFSKTISFKPMALALVVSLFLLLGGIVLTARTTYQQVHVIASEIAINHQKEFKIEFPANDITDLADAMPKLDFTPTISQHMDWPSYQVMGSRYCTIYSSIATQIRLKDTNNEAYTLYQFRPPDSLSLPDESTLIIDGVTVKIWHEGDLIMGLAQSNVDREE